MPEPNTRTYCLMPGPIEVANCWHNVRATPACNAQSPLPSLASHCHHHHQNIHTHTAIIIANVVEKHKDSYFCHSPASHTYRQCEFQQVGRWTIFCFTDSFLGFLNVWLGPRQRTFDDNGAGVCCEDVLLSPNQECIILDCPQELNSSQQQWSRLSQHKWLETDRKRVLHFRPKTVPKPKRKLLDIFGRKRKRN